MSDLFPLSAERYSGPATVLPIVVFGGPYDIALYQDMAVHLATLTGQPASVVETKTSDWSIAGTSIGWSVVLRRLEHAVNSVAHISTTGRITLICHDIAGLLARFYLSPYPLFGHAYHGQRNVSHLITLGSPHAGRNRRSPAGLLTRWVEKHNPGTFFAPGVEYTAVAGRFVFGNLQGSPHERQAYDAYKALCGVGQVWGDGAVPIESALLPQAQRVVLAGTAHSPQLGRSWYGSPDTVHLWWDASTGGSSAF
jgi:hypothetical protein